VHLKHHRAVGIQNPTRPPGPLEGGEHVLACLGETSLNLHKKPLTNPFGVPLAPRIRAGDSLNKRKNKTSHQIQAGTERSAAP